MVKPGTGDFIKGQSFVRGSLEYEVMIKNHKNEHIKNKEDEKRFQRRRNTPARVTNR